MLKRFKKFLKRTLTHKTIADSLGLKYVGIFDGNDLSTMIKLLSRIKENQEPVFLHVKTKKGKGYKEAEENSSKFHGIGKNLQVSTNTFSNAVSPILNELIKTEPNIYAITAGMTDGVGLTDFAFLNKNHFLDVGIAEESAVTIASGMAKGGLKPIVFIYSTFLQRSYDQILHDVCLQNLPVIFCLDRAGLTGSDGKTHQGVFDLSYLRHIPNMTLLAPKDTIELKKMLEVSLKLNKPIAIRYPNGVSNVIDEVEEFDKTLKWERLCDEDKITVLAVGGRMIKLAYELKEKVKHISIINARTVNPLDEETLLSINSKKIITLEDNAIKGGFGESVLAFYNNKDIDKKIYTFGVEDRFVEHASVESQMKFNGLTVENIIKTIDLK